MGMQRMYVEPVLHRRGSVSWIVYLHYVRLDLFFVRFHEYLDTPFLQGNVTPLLCLQSMCCETVTQHEVIGSSQEEVAHV